MSMVKDFIAYTQAHFPDLEKSTTLLAVSGGRDSVVMCDLFAQADYPFAIAHVNFKLRGKDSDKDAAFVEALAARYGVPYHSVAYDTKTYAQTHKVSIQMAARDLRFAFFEQLCQTHHYPFYATAHHQGDAVETCLINQLRGCGLSGLHGILPKQGKLIHPLLFATRTQVDSYVAQHHLYFREDATNAQEKYVRNKIRHSLIPLLEDIQPNVARILWQNTQRLQAAEDVYKQGIAALKKQYENKDDSVINIDKLRSNNSAVTLLYEWLSPLGFNHSQCTQILHGTAIDTNAQRFLSDTHVATLNRGKLYIAVKDTQVENVSYTINKGDTFVSKPLPIRIEYKEGPVKIEREAHIALLDADKLKFPLQLRQWQTGDRFAPLGMKGKAKLLSDFFTDLKLSPQDKNNVWLLCSGTTIVWVVGYRISHHAKIAADTKAVVRLVLQP